MPTIIVQSAPYTDSDRADLASMLTNTAVELAQVEPEKVQIFFGHRLGTLGSVEVHALDYDGAGSAAAWETAFRRALRYHLNVSVHFYPLDRAAKGGVLRSALAATTSNPAEESQ
ncbi:MAG: hypothetical protein JSS68_06210 [Actinobacteria bacterium]|nr:hypothetical protein [Actinomycetota bacterium]